MSDEQMAREWLLPLLQDMVAKVLSDHTVLKEQQRIIEQVDALLASRALEARKEALEEAARACEADNTGAFMEANIRRAFAEKIRSLAAASRGDS